MARPAWRSLLLLGAAALLLNLLPGDWTADRLGLPLALGHTGSVLAGLLLGPTAGALVGALSLVPPALAGADASALAFFSALLPALWTGWMAGMAGKWGGLRAPLHLFGAAVAAAVGAALLGAIVAAAPQGGVNFGAAFTEGLRAGLQATATSAGALERLGGPLLAFVLGSLLAWPLARRFSPSRALAPGLTEAPGQAEALGRALVGWLVTLTAAWFILPLLGRPVLALFFLPVLFSVWRLSPPAGARAGLLATALGALAGPLLIAPPVGHGPLLATDWVWILLFLPVALYMVFITDTLQRRSQAMVAAAASHRQANARLAALAAGIDESLLLIAPDRTISLANRRLQELLAQSMADLQGRPLEEAEAILGRAFADPATFAHFVAETLAEPAGEAAGLLEQEWPVARELAIRTLPVQGREEYFGRLYLLRDRTREREAEQLQLRLASVVSEELRAPALRVRALATTLIEGGGGELSETHLRLLTTLRTHADRQLAFLDRLGETVRLESEGAQLNLAPVDLAALIHETAAQMRPLLHEKKQSLTVDTAADLPALHADATRLKLALTNLISNAHKFNAPGGWVRIEARRDATQPGKQLRIVVSDGGFGIAPADQKRLGDRFFRVENDQTRDLGGTGLGLTLTMAIVRLHGGEVEIDSAPGRGSTFAIQLPLAQPKEAPALPAKQPASDLPAEPELDAAGDFVLPLPAEPEPDAPAPPLTAAEDASKPAPEPDDDGAVSLDELTVTEVVEAPAPRPAAAPDEGADQKAGEAPDQGADQKAGNEAGNEAGEGAGEGVESSAAPLAPAATDTDHTRLAAAIVAAMYQVHADAAPVSPAPRDAPPDSSQTPLAPQAQDEHANGTRETPGATQPAEPPSTPHSAPPSAPHQAFPASDPLEEALHEATLPVQPPPAPPLPSGEDPLEGSFESSA